MFLYKQVLQQPLRDDINAVRAPKRLNVPVVMSREEVRAIITLMQGTPQLIAKLLYGCGLRVMEAVRRWTDFAKEAGVTGAQIKKIQTSQRTNL